MKKLILGISVLSLLSGCEVMSSRMTPKSIKDSVAQNAAISAEISTRVTTLSDEQIKTYIEKNAEAWNQLDLFYNGD